jgi:competence protein ComEC
MSGRTTIGPLSGGFLVGAAIGLAGIHFPSAALLLLLGVLWRPAAPLAFLAAGWLGAHSARAEPAPAPQAPVALEGRVASIPRPIGSVDRLRIDEPSGRSVELTVARLPHPLAPGDRVRTVARLRVPSGPPNPGAPDRAALLGARGIALEGDGLVPPVRTASPSPLAWIEAGRRRLAEASASLPPREAALIRAVGVGDRGALDPATADAFAASGLAHLLAVSGLHLAVVALALERALRALLGRLDRVAARVDPGRLAALLTLPVVALYALATGAGAPVRRAALGAGLALGGAVVGREPSPGNALALAALALAAGEPGALLDPSLQLSFTAVAGLLLLAGPLRAALPWPPPPPGTAAARLLEPPLRLLCASLAATAATAPLVALHFHRLPLAGALVNLVGVPLGTALTVVAAVAAALAAAWPPLAAPALLLARPLAMGLLALADAVASIPGASLHVASPGPWLAATATGLVLSLGRLRGLPLGLGVAGAIAALALPGPARRLAAVERGRLEVIFVSVGQGDAALLRLPDGAAVLVDAGGDPSGRRDPGERDLVPLLADLGVERLAAVVVSHPHPDHVLGLVAVARALPVERLFLGGEPPEGAVREALSGLPRPERLPPEGWARAGVRLEPVVPPGPELTGNDASLVLRVRHGRVRLLFPGDVEAAGEAWALRGDLSADLVKVPHHGSRTSSSAPFVAAVGARVAVVSLGARNRFGFPHAEAVARWRAAGASVLRTDEGALRFLSDGARLRRVEAGLALDPLAVLREREEGR